MADIADIYDIYRNERAACLSKLIDQDTGECLASAEKNYQQKLQSIRDKSGVDPTQDFCFGAIGGDRSICELQRTILYSPYANSRVIIFPY